MTSAQDHHLHLHKRYLEHVSLVPSVPTKVAVQMEIAPLDLVIPELL